MTHKHMTIVNRIRDSWNEWMMQYGRDYRAHPTRVLLGTASYYEFKQALQTSSYYVNLLSDTFMGLRVERVFDKPADYVEVC